MSTKKGINNDYESTPPTLKSAKTYGTKKSPYIKKIHSLYVLKFPHMDSIAHQINDYKQFIFLFGNTTDLKITSKRVMLTTL